MIEQQLRTGPVRVKLADAVRAVNARHCEVGGAELPELKQAWLNLDRSLSLATLAGDERAAHIAVNRYREEGIRVCDDQADRLAAKNGGNR